MRVVNDNEFNTWADAAKQKYAGDQRPRPTAVAAAARLSTQPAATVRRAVFFTGRSSLHWGRSHSPGAGPRRRPRGLQTGPAGGVITLPVSLGAGESCQAEYGGSFWTVRNDSDTTIPSGTRARIARVHDLTLLVRPEK